MASTQAISISDALAEKQKELDALFVMIDEAQEEFDNLYAEAAAKRLELDKLQREKGITQKVKLARELESTSHGSNSRRVDESKFSGEHLEYIRNRRNTIDDLRQQVEKIHSETNPLEEEVTALQQDAVTLKHRQIKYQQKLERRESERKEMQHQVTLTKDMLKETSADVTAHQSVARDAEIALSGLIARKDIMESQLDGNSALMHSLRDLDNEISIAEDRVQALDDDLAKLHEDRTTYEDNTAQELDGNKTAQNWRADESHMRGEWDRVRQDLADTDQELKNTLSRIKEKEVRYDRLVPIVRKWKTRVRGDTRAPSDESVDKLLRQCNRSLTNSTKLVKTRAGGLERLSLENSRLEAAIASKREQLLREIQQFERDKAQLRSTVLQKRTSAFDLEHHLIDQISQLKRRVAQKRCK